MMGQESGGSDTATSSADAVGRLQIHLPSHPEVTREQAQDPDFNMNWGMHHLAGLKHEFGSWRLALAAYNAGSGAVKKYGGVPPYQETQDYVRNILGKAGALRSGMAQPVAREAHNLEVAGSSPAPAPSVSLNTSQEGLRALAQGSYNPTEQLQGLLDQQSQPQPSQPGVSGEGTQTATPVSPPITIQGKATKKALAAVELIQRYLGTPYVWGGEQPGGFDCSGLLQYVWAQRGVQIPRVSQDQWNFGKPVARSALQPGDAVFFHKAGHVGMYIGGGRFIEAPHTGANVRISKLAGRKDYLGARRFA